MSRLRLRPLAARIVLATVSALLTAGLAELAIRALQPQPRLVIEPGGFYLEDPPAHRLAPGYRGRIYNRTEYEIAVRVNRDGLRGPEPAPPGNAFRLLAIGDSFTFGVGVEDDQTFVARAAAELTGAGRPAVPLNAGIPDTGVQDAVRWLDRHGGPLEPDLVVLAVFLGNDLGDASPERAETRIVDGLPVPSRSPGGLKAWLHRHSHLYLLLKKVADLPALLPLRERLGLSKPWAVATLEAEFEVYRRPPPPWLQRAIETLDGAIAEYSNLARERGFEATALLIPNDLEVDPERWRSALEQLRLDPAAYDPATPRRVFLELFDRYGIPVLDTTPLVTAELAAGEPLYYRHDRHWTARAHALAGRELAELVRERLPQQP